jgi:hypothetical protein
VIWAPLMTMSLWSGLLDGRQVALSTVVAVTAVVAIDFGQVLYRTVKRPFAQQSPALDRFNSSIGS